MVPKEDNTILLHACCGICSAYPIGYLKELGYCPVVYFSNSNLCDKDEFYIRLGAQKKVCNYHSVDLVLDEYNHDAFLDYVKGYENEPEKGQRCIKCIEYRLMQTIDKANELGIKKISTSLVISPHKNFSKISDIGKNLVKNIEYVAIDFKKKDGFLKTNKLSKELNLYRQNFCGCEFSKNK